ncbi:E3 ubiquitin-protein ligase Rnf220-like isoform X2 [Hyla sarda]|nr:E3 ubiquitin-protein ligase Rnf220-like isoform X2 [Hyla sarda]XP_056426193.1 E3 ubiquitin-protein ligase Rnf220-like isoform X2 [Hyla sarda]XP_056426194.1 E3 ubiquitin-protein ligase Rnf220-like isoform X2 [Hyla sarda]XP_056426195.1 E3 ubiquitin-protein ligase Rnf220-like isoform X2 [Hyla sarda]XP_056426196.1 E3 ubiquitin-protein ligase Rnf220-like isoform X2 [Hyla sarda]XP_056426197.1 E3 ubiquitin-protein ligase Rnf220-like isoform X2 [Hyla sarda]
MCFTMESTPGLINQLTSQALLVMATSADGPLGMAQQPPLYTVPLGMDKPPQMTYLSPAYPLLYPPQEHLNSACAPQLLSLSHQYGPPRLDRGGVGVLGYSALHPFAFRLPESVERLQAGFLNAKRLKGDSEPPQLHYLPMETGLEASHVSPGPMMSPTSHRSSPKPRTSSHKRDKKSPLTLPLLCPLCHKHLQKEELTQHLLQEMDQLAHLSDSELDGAPESSKNYTQSPQQRRDTRSDSPLMTSEDGQKLDRQQVFQQIRWNREERLGARAGRCKRQRLNPEEPLRGVPADSEATEENHWDDEMRSPEKASSHGTGCRGSPGIISPSHSEDSDSEETPASSHANEESLGALREKIHELTEKLKNTHTCHICLDAYTVPVASIQCWHVHCEGCWLRALGSKKLCPQCNTITSPSDLRRVYL